MNQTPQNLDHLKETMLYKCPGPHEIHGGRFDYVIVPEVDIPEAQAQGWHLTTSEAKEAHENEINAPSLPVSVVTIGSEVVVDGVTMRVSETLPASEILPAILPITPAEMNATAPAPESINGIPVHIGYHAAKEIEQQELSAPPTYTEMKRKAEQLGLEFQGNISKAALMAMITAKLAEQV